MGERRLFVQYNKYVFRYCTTTACGTKKLNIQLSQVKKIFEIQMPMVQKDTTVSCAKGLRIQLPSVQKKNLIYYCLWCKNFLKYKYLRCTKSYDKTSSSIKGLKIQMPVVEKDFRYFCLCYNKT